MLIVLSGLPGTGKTTIARELAKQHMTPEQSLDTVRDAVREHYGQEMEAKRSLSIEPPIPEKDREPEEPEP
jgi:adenylate kinase family enzyme